LVAAILEAAAQVLRDEGAPRFTTARVAEKAGVSIGSLYQYFPNKAALLFRLQAEEWASTTALIGDILGDRATPPSERLRRVVIEFVRSECEEAELRVALGDAAPLYRAAPEAELARIAGVEAMRRFVDEALPRASSDTRKVAADLLEMTLSAVGKRISQTSRGEHETEAHASALADMLCAAFAMWSDIA
jgi:AcrR family transcriptional regulator